MIAEPRFAIKALITCVVVIVPTGLRFLLGASANPVPFVTYYPAVMLCAVFLGWRWAAFATVISSAVVSRVFLARPWMEDPGPPDLAIFVFFSFSCAILIATGDTLRRAVRQAERTAEERELFGREMLHRIQNTLAVVIALVRTSKADSVDTLKQDLLGRIFALSKANRVLQSRSAEGAEVRQLISQATTAFQRDGGFDIDGPSRSLPAEMAHHLLLILHELCTNALKHGSLSAPQGRVCITWTPEPLPFCLEWREEGGPPVTPPQRKGLGAQLFAGQPAYDVAIDYRQSGVACTIVPSHRGEAK